MQKIAEAVISFTEDNFSLDDKYLESALDIAERVSKSSDDQKEFIDTIKQVLTKGSQFIVLQTLLLLDIVVKNSNRYLKLDVSSRTFITALRKTTKFNIEKVNQRLLELVSEWIRSNEFVGPEHDLMREFYHELLTIVPFPENVNSTLRLQSQGNEDQPISVTKGPSFTKHPDTFTIQSSEDQFSNDLRTAIKMSLEEQKKFSRETNSRDDQSIAALQSPVSRTDRRSNVVKALFDFKDIEEGELMFSKDDRITIIDDSQPYWWKGVSNGKVGLFPSTFVEPIVDSPCDQDKPYANGQNPDEQTAVHQQQSLIDTTLLDNCVDALKNADIEAMPGSDPQELRELEDRCMKMAPEIETTISMLDTLIDSCQKAHEQLLEAIRDYDNECQREATRLLTQSKN